MSNVIKRWLTRLFTPLAKVFYRLLSPAQRLWAHISLGAKITTHLDPSVVVLGCPEIRGTGYIHFGKNLLLYRELYLETQEQGTIAIGDNVVISRGVHIVAFSQVNIGTNTMIGEYTSVRDANHQFGGDQPIREAGHSSIPITIGQNVWIGRGVTVLAGVTIGDNAVIGANAVVTKDIPANTLAVGIPARLVKKL
ncbi:MAG: transferase [Beggiatoa sp. IS2]|nr:MAG: transferase [Beggiatoa sp. IS2]